MGMQIGRAGGAGPLEHATDEAEGQAGPSEPAEGPATAPATRAPARGASGGRQDMLARMAAPAAPAQAAAGAAGVEKKVVADGLDRHIRYFDINGDEKFTFAEISQGIHEMGFSKLSSNVMAAVLANVLPDNIADMRKVRHDDSGTYRKSDGSFDEAAFDRWFRDADTDGSGTLSRLELVKSTLRIADDAFSHLGSHLEFQLMHTIIATDGQASRQAVHDFFSGEFFEKIIAKRQQKA